VFLFWFQLTLQPTPLLLPICIQSRRYVFSIIASVDRYNCIKQAARVLSIGTWCNLSGWRDGVSLGRYYPQCQSSQDTAGIDMET